MLTLFCRTPSDEVSVPRMSHDRTSKAAASSTKPSYLLRHPRESGDPEAAEHDVCPFARWVPAFAGMTKFVGIADDRKHRSRQRASRARGPPAPAAARFRPARAVRPADRLVAAVLAV